MAPTLDVLVLFIKGQKFGILSRLEAVHLNSATLPGFKDFKQLIENVLIVLYSQQSY